MAKVVGHLRAGGVVEVDADVRSTVALDGELAGEGVVTVEELSKALKVSTKTISRWRQQGLVSRRFVFDGRKRVGFLQSSVDRFVHHNEDRVQRGTRFSQLTDEERSEIVELGVNHNTLRAAVAAVPRRDELSLRPMAPDLDAWRSEPSQADG